MWHDRHFPVFDPTPQQLAQGYVDFFEPDVFVESQAGLFDRIGIPKGELEFGHPRLISLESFSTYEGHHEADLLFGLNVYFVYKQLYKREFKFVPRHERHVAIFESSNTDDAFIAAYFGEFPTEGSLRPLAQAYRHAFDPVSLVPSVENWVRVLKEGFELPLDFTDEGLRQEPQGWRSEPTLFIVDPASTLDIIDLWNIRQFHPHIIGIPLLWLEQGKDFIAEFVRLNYRPLPGNPNGVMIRTTLQFGRSISEERAKAAIAEAGLNIPAGGPDIPWTVKPWYDRIWKTDRDDVVVQPRRTMVSAAKTDLDLQLSKEVQYSGCQFRTLAPEMAPRFSFSAARWVNVLAFNTFGLVDDLALTLPSSFTDISRHRVRISGTTIMSREGWVLPQQHKDHGEYVRIPPGKQAIIDWLGSRGVKAEPSDPGRIADQILGSLKGFWGVRIIADRETLKLLNDMSKSVRKHADGKVEEFPDRAVEVKRWKDLVNRRSSSHFGGVSLEEFVSANILRLGLALQCPHCYKNNWFGIESLRTTVSCERCLKIFDFPQGSLNFGRTPWQYRVVGPYSVPDYAEGAYATVLALNVFARSLGGDHANVTYATGLNVTIGNEEPFEVDFGLWYQRRHLLEIAEKPVLVLGESKSFAVESFKAIDLERMRKLGEMFPGAFLAFTTLKDALSENERFEIGRLAMWGRERLPDGRPRSPVIVLTGTEAFAGWSVQHAWEQLSDRRAEFATAYRARLENLWTFATITQQIYLNLPDPFRPPPPGAGSAARPGVAQEYSVATSEDGDTTN
jgi:hypothetical protein